MSSTSSSGQREQTPVRGSADAAPKSPIAVALSRIDALDVEAFTALFAADGQLLTLDSKVATNADEVRDVIGQFVAQLRATTHRITAEWHPDEATWIAELEATYELTDFARLGPLPRAAVLRAAPAGIARLSVYGQHELPLSQSHRRFQEVRAGRHWLPTL